MSIFPLLPLHARPATRRPLPQLVSLFFAADVFVIVAAVVTHLIAQHNGVAAPGFFRLSYESNLPTWYSSAQHAVVGTLLALLAIREIRIDPRRWCIALPAMMFLFFSFDEVAMVHERIGYWVSAHSSLGAKDGMTNSAPAMVLCLPAAIAFAAYAAWNTRPYWTGRPGVMFKFTVGIGLFLFCAGGLEILVNLVKTNQMLVSLETLVEESGEMLSTTVVLWGTLELLALEKFALRFDAAGMHFGDANKR
ncbi:hypothetical protein BH10PLA1_BH10PLA1_23280 [soil metagenome]